MNLTELSKQIYSEAKEKGYYRKVSEKGTGLMLIVENSLRLLKQTVTQGTQTLIVIKLRLRLTM